MKFFFFISLMVSMRSFSYELGRVTISGDCESKTKPVETEKLDRNGKKIYIPLQIFAEKKNHKLIERSICSVRIPMTVRKGESLIIKNVKQEAETTLDVKSKAVLNLDVSVVGINPEVRLFVESKNSKKLRMASDNKPIVTDCGQEIMLNVDSAVRIEGTGLGKIISKPVSLDIISQSCK